MLIVIVVLFGEYAMRITISLSDVLLSRVDSEANKQNTSRSETIARVIETHYADLHKHESEIKNFNTLLRSKDEEILFLRSHVSQLSQNIAQLSLPGPRLNDETEPESEYTIARTPLWKRLKFWSWV